MTQTNVSIETAPRSVEALVALGRFQLRTLAIALGFRENAEKWSSFMACDNQQGAEAVLEHLQFLDKQKSGEASNSGGGKAETKRTPSNGKSSSRTPSTKEKPTESTAKGGESASEAAVEKLLTRLTSIEKLIGAIDDKVNEMAGAVAAVDEAKEITFAAMSLNLKIAEELMKASSKDILTAAVEDIPSFRDALLEQLGYSTRESEGEEEAGN